MNRAQRRRDKAVRPTAIPATWGEAWERCPFRSFVGFGKHPGDVDEMGSRISHMFAALGGEAAAIAPELMAEMVGSIQAGGTVLVMSDRADLRDQAKREILVQLHGAAGTV